MRYLYYSSHLSLLFDDSLPTPHKLDSYTRSYQTWGDVLGQQALKGSPHTILLLKPRMCRLGFTQDFCAGRGLIKWDRSLLI